jgi:hypothetical protein
MRYNTYIYYYISYLGVALESHNSMGFTDFARFNVGEKPPTHLWKSSYVRVVGICACEEVKLVTLILIQKIK